MAAPSPLAWSGCRACRGSWGVTAMIGHRLQRKQPGLRAEKVAGQCYEDMVDELAVRTISRASPSGPRLPRYIVGVAGPPGAGKSTLVNSVAARINELSSLTPAVVVPMDGFHLYRRDLDAMEDPKEAYARRGAHWTFDAHQFVQCVRAVKEQPEVTVPSFDHCVGDPVPDDIHVEAHHKIVLVEGNYLLLDMPPWNEMSGLFDDTWFLELPLDVAMFRVFTRQTSLGVSPMESKQRINYNDYPNAELIQESKGQAQVLVPADLPMKG